MRIEVCVPGDPIPKGRPRACVARGKIRTYTPDRTRDAENALGYAMLIQMRKAGWPNQGWPKARYRVEMDFVLRRDGADVDNLTKTVLDAGNKLLWSDDRRVDEIVARKRHAAKGEQPSTRVVVTALPE